MTTIQHAGRIAMLMAAAAALLGWEIYHSEATFADGLRYIHRAERIEQESLKSGLLQGVDHPLHPLGIAAAHRLMGGTGPGAWQHAAVGLCFAAAVMLVIPTYLLALELFGPQAAWLACVLALVNPIIGYVVVNVLSESTFLLWWTFGLWADGPVPAGGPIPLAPPGHRLQRCWPTSPVPRGCFFPRRSS